MPADLDEKQLEELERALGSMTRPETWRGGNVDRTDIFVHHPEGLAGNCGERVILRANPHFPYDADVQGCAAIVAAAPQLLSAARESLALRERVARLEDAARDVLRLVTHEERCHLYLDGGCNCRMAKTNALRSLLPSGPAASPQDGGAPRDSDEAAAMSARLLADAAKVPPRERFAEMERVGLVAPSPPEGAAPEAERDYGAFTAAATIKRLREERDHYRALVVGGSPPEGEGRARKTVCVCDECGVSMATAEDEWQHTGCGGVIRKYAALTPGREHREIAALAATSHPPPTGKRDGLTVGAALMLPEVRDGSRLVEWTPSSEHVRHQLQLRGDDIYLRWMASSLDLKSEGWCRWRMQGLGARDISAPCVLVAPSTPTSGEG